MKPPILKQPWVIWSAVLLLLIFVCWLDYITGDQVRLFIFYFIPISLAAWYLGRRGGVLAAVKVFVGQNLVTQSAG